MALLGKQLVLLGFFIRHLLALLIQVAHFSLHRVDRPVEIVVSLLQLAYKLAQTRQVLLNQQN
jgi:hypothetical protein